MVNKDLRIFRGNDDFCGRKLRVCVKQYTNLSPIDTGDTLIHVVVTKMDYAWQFQPGATFSTITWSTLSIGALALAVVVHKIIVHLDYPLLSLPELAWNHFLHFMPAKLVYALHSGSTRFRKTGRNIDNGSSDHATKSDVMRDVLGLSRGDTASRGTDPAPRGLGNWDNSCFQNSVLQALSSLSDLRQFLHQFEDGSQNKSPSTSIALRSLMEDLNNGGDYIWPPAKLKSMNSWQQQDAQEYYSKIMDSLENDVKAMLKDAIVVEDKGLSGFTVLESVKDMQDSGIFLEKDDLMSKQGLKQEAPSNPLEGLVAQRIGCLRCGYNEGLSLIPFNCLTVPLGKESVVDIRDCLDSFSDLELIEGVQCGKCTLLSAEKSLKTIMNISNTTGSGENAPKIKQQALKIRLQAIRDALETSTFSDDMLSKTCHIPAKLRITSTKSRQAVMMRPPKCLVLHINRSLFDENTGMLSKNQAHVIFPATLDLGAWCIGGGHPVQPDGQEKLETWEMDPAKSMRLDCVESSSRMQYQLRAAIIHQGRHENGHYICYRKMPRPYSVCSSEEVNEQWWRLSDEQVWKVTQDDVLAQGGVFMLFYEQHATKLKDEHFPAGSEDLDLDVVKVIEEKSEDMRAVADQATDGNS
jgi:ubiquitin carboxyl-terminal hydrolase 1